MAVHVEGDWKNFTFRMIEPGDYPQIRQFHTKNMVDETVSSLSPADDQYPEFANNRIIQKIDEHRHLCFLALDRQSGYIAGLQLQFKWTKVEAHTPYPEPSPDQAPTPPTHRLLAQIYQSLEKTKLGIFDRFNVDFVCWNFLTGTPREWRNQGLASEMYRRMVLLLDAEGFSVVFSVFTSPFSRRCAEKTGFMEIDRVGFTEVCDGEGNRLLPRATDKDFAAVMVLKMK